ncbi:MAG: C_GCAxxG_C_C family protein [Synergistaceae bacterium]|nr:C_GCAxxG_C_C family protein [Synergistaceae bacterium]
MTREDFVKSIRETAEEYFRSGTFFCSEAVLQTINDALGKPFSDEIVKMASSFPIGLGKAQCLCGAVSGGEMALGIVYGRVKGQPMNPKMFEVAKGFSLLAHKKRETLNHSQGLSIFYALHSSQRSNKSVK